MAFPILMYHSVPASGHGDDLAVPVDLLDRQWRALRAEGWTLTNLSNALTQARAYPNGRVIGVTFDDGYADFVNVPELLAKHQSQATLYLPTAQLGEVQRPGQQWLSWEEVAKFPADLVEIGSHAHHHRPLDVLPRAEAEDEVGKSRSLLTERLGISPVSFCYPNGYFSAPVLKMVAAAGFVNGCIVGRRLADPYGDPLALPRLHVTAGHDEAAIIKLVETGEIGLTPRLKRVAYPYWRFARKSVYRTTGVILT